MGLARSGPHRRRCDSGVCRRLETTETRSLYRFRMSLREARGKKNP
jgi:hypothetical protein